MYANYLTESYEYLHVLNRTFHRMSNLYSEQLFELGYYIQTSYVSCVHTKKIFIYNTNKS